LKGDGKKARSPFLRKLALSAAQSLMFNHYLTERMVDGFFRRVIPGDVMMKWPAGGMFTVEDLEAEQRRFDSREIVTGGPMFGRKTFAAKGEAAEREAKILSDAGLTPTSFDGFGKLLMGTRRHNLIYVDDLQATQETSGLRVTFSLPAGSYATVLLGELMKSTIASIEAE
jgi:tRNA pseudouridine13 synthase